MIYSAGRWNAALRPRHLPGTKDGWLTPAPSDCLHSSIPQANRLRGHIYKTDFAVTKWEGRGGTVESILPPFTVLETCTGKKEKKGGERIKILTICRKV